MIIPQNITQRYNIAFLLLTSLDYCDSIELYYCNSLEVFVLEVKLFDSEVKVMELVWEREPITAKELSVLANDAYGWNKNTTYTVIKKLIDKDILLRSEPNFVCTSLIKKETVQKEETNQLIKRLFSGSKKAFFAAFLQDETLSKEEYEELREMIDKKREI